MENEENRDLLGLWDIGTTEILLNVVYKVETWSSDSFQPYFPNNLGFGVQKRSKMA